MSTDEHGCMSKGGSGGGREMYVWRSCGGELAIIGVTRSVRVPWGSYLGVRFSRKK